MSYKFLDGIKGLPQNKNNDNNKNIYMTLVIIFLKYLLIISYYTLNYGTILLSLMIRTHILYYFKSDKFIIINNRE